MSGSLQSCPIEETAFTDEKAGQLSNMQRMSCFTFVLRRERPMNLARTRIAAIVSGVAIVMLAGCAGTGSQVLAPSHPASSHQAQQSSGLSTVHSFGFLSPLHQPHNLVWQGNAGRGWISPDAAHRRLVYVADENGQAVYIFPQKGNNQSPIGKITSGLLAPNGLFVDGSRKLYVCNFGGGTVTVYRHGSITPLLTLTGAGSAIDVVVGRDGTVYVSNWDSGSAGTVLEYPKGQTTPSTTININGAPEGLALDSSNNLYVAYNDNTSFDGEVLKFAPGGTVGTNLGIHVGYVGGATMDSQNNLLLDDQNIPGVDIFPPGATQPSSQIKGFPLAFDIALTHGDSKLWVTDPNGIVNEVSYPTGTIINTISNTITSAFGVATSPDGSK
jgi:hypothetical protein